MTMVGIAGIPAGALEAIKDENTRQVLQAIVDGWHVRNGVSGKGDNRFVTVGELGTASGYRLIGGLKQAVQEETVKKPGITPGEIGRVIADLQASIMESALWKNLGQRVNIIEAGGGVGMTEERTQRINDDNALITAINTMWATIGDNSALVQRGQEGVVNNAGAVAAAWQQVQSTIKDPVTGAYIATAAVRQTAETAVNKAGDLEGKYTVKVDVNGHVSGFGLASTANNSTPFSRFIVRADQFAIGSPSMPDYIAYVNAYPDVLAAWNAAGQPDKRDYGYNHYVTFGQSEGRVVPNAIQETIPFIVTTTAQTLNGRTVPPGVYMDAAFIRNGSITTADIGVAMVDTLVIQGNAVTQPVTASQGANVNFTGSYTFGDWVDIVPVTLNYGPDALNARAIIGFTLKATVGSGGFWAVKWRVRREDGLILGDGEQGASNNDVGDLTVTATVFEPGTSGSRTYTLQAAIYGDIKAVNGIYRTIYGATIYGLGAKR